MSKAKKSSTDLKILFQELDLALDKADFHLSERLCDELIEVAHELYIEGEKSQERIPIIRQ